MPVQVFPSSEYYDNSCCSYQIGPPNPVNTPESLITLMEVLGQLDYNNVKIIQQESGILRIISIPMHHQFSVLMLHHPLIQLIRKINLYFPFIAV